MDKDYILSVAETIRKQLFLGTDPDIIGSWAVSNPVATVFNEMPSFGFQADARLFKGIVIIALNSSDLYEVYLLNKDTKRCVSNEVYADQLGEIIDTAIESGDNPEEYKKFCEAQRSLLVNNVIIL